MNSRRKINGWFNQIFIFPIRLYKGILSPYLRRACRFTPTCSEYTILSIQKYGPFQGIRMGFLRILKCHPWGGHGYDPVP
jgi:putative membrane protein insertion efficiency factor